MTVPHDLSESSVEVSVVYEGSFLRLRKDLVRLPDGQLTAREFVEHPGAAAMIALTDDGRIIVEHQFRYPLGRTFIEIPAGKLDAGETSLATAQRELVEETGYRAREWALLTTIHPAIGFATEVIDLYLCRDLEYVGQALDDGEHLDLELVTLEWLLEELRGGRLSDVKTQIAVFWLERLRAGVWPWPEFQPA
ncbi:MAG: NUDIX hydrolase [Burkholderiaceae bacterium]|nr:NUDIX hydrolase [Burkholderiaceae bacterium]